MEAAALAMTTVKTRTKMKKITMSGIPQQQET